jgi:hypothetical protein
MRIDAISINQVDIEERSLQVIRMGAIYKHAQRVVVWLGLASTDSSLVTDALGRIGRQVKYTKSNDILPAPECSEKTWYRTIDTADPDSDSKTWLAVHSLLLCPWFDRLWVIQEIQLANWSGKAAEYVRHANDDDRNSTENN